jgi:hypothetical protein
LPVSGFALLHGALSFADTAADKQIFNTVHDFLLPSYLFALKNAFANPGGVMALKSASVCGCAHASCGISACADLCRYAKLGLPRPDRVYSGSLFGTSSQLLYNFFGILKLPHIAVRFVHGSPYYHG